MGTRPRHDSLPLPVFSFICEHLCPLWINLPSPFMSASCSSVAWAVSAHPPPESSDTDDATEAGRRVRAHGVQIRRPGQVGSRASSIA